jgi:hypothetical protein
VAVAGRRVGEIRLSRHECGWVEALRATGPLRDMEIGDTPGGM